MCDIMEQARILVRMIDTKEEVIRKHAKKIAKLINDKKLLSNKIAKIRGELSEVYNQVYDLCYERDDCPDALERLGKQIDIIYNLEKELLK